MLPCAADVRRRPLRSNTLRAQVRELVAAAGMKLLALKRTRIGGLRLTELKRGTYT